MGKKKISVMRLMSQHQRIQNNKSQTKNQQAVGKGSTERCGIDALQSNLPDLRNYVRLVRGVGNNLFECESLHNLLADQKHKDEVNNASMDNDAQLESNVVLCELSRKLRNFVWLKRGCWLLVEPFDRDMKIYGEIVRPLDDDDFESLCSQVQEVALILRPQRTEYSRKLSIDSDASSQFEEATTDQGEVNAQ
ncbi:hypothetical protein MIR68_010412 [Amoeboaphelidium protococcarum]|nr:hypothetical protein MIR68_010412 [Amoeboaphelidium protococcarum]